MCTLVGGTQRQKELDSAEKTSSRAERQATNRSYQRQILSRNDIVRELSINMDIVLIKSFQQICCI